MIKSRKCKQFSRVWSVQEYSIRPDKDALSNTHNLDPQKPGGAGVYACITSVKSLEGFKRPGARTNLRSLHSFAPQSTRILRLPSLAPTPVLTPTLTIPDGSEHPSHFTHHLIHSRQQKYMMPLVTLDDPPPLFSLYVST